MICTGTPAPRVRLIEALIAGGLVACGTLVAVVLGARLGAVLDPRAAAPLIGALVAAALIVFLAVRWPVPTAIAMVAFVPVNRFVILLVYHFSHSTVLTKGFELWKDGLLVALVIKVTLDLLFTPDRSRRLRAMDLLVLLFLGVSLVYVADAGPLALDPFTRVQGFRADSEFMLAYWVGRGLQLGRRQLRLMLMAIIPGSILVAVVAFVQFVLPGPTNAFFTWMGYQDFVVFSGNTGDPIAVRFRDIPGAESLPRASSLALGDLALAFFQLLTVSIAAAIFSLGRRATERVAAALFLGLMVVTLLLTLTRSAVGSAIASLTAVVVVSRPLFRYGLLAVVMAAVALALVTAGMVRVATLGPLTSFTDASSVAHGVAVSNSLQQVEQDPIGRGLGTGGSVGQAQLGRAAITSESWYLQLGTEMGVLGMASYVLVVAVATGLGFWQFLRVRDHWLRVLSLSVAGTGLAFLVAGNFLHAWQNTPVSMVFWLLAGITVRAQSLDASPEYATRPARP